MDAWLFLVGGIAIIHFYLQQKDKRRLAYTMHIQGQTEQAESFAFAVSLFDDESEEAWQKKIDKACYLSEKRRSFQNERLLAIQMAQKEQFDKAQEAKKKIQSEPKQALKAVQAPVEQTV